MAALARVLDARVLTREQPFDQLLRWSEQTMALDGQELLVSALLEPHGALIDDLADGFEADESAGFAIDGAGPVSALAAAIRERYPFALALNFGSHEEQARFWYTSEAKLEPRLGQRFEEAGAEREQPLGIARDVAALLADLERCHPAMLVAAFLVAHPEHRHVVRRVQRLSQHPYGEIRDNLLAAGMRPVDLLRFKLALFGAGKFDPRSDRWLRVTFFQDTPFPAIEEAAADSATGSPSPQADATGAAVSRNEAEMIALKAARGSGLAWGIAEEAAFACRWLAEYGLGFAPALVAALSPRLAGIASVLERGPTLTGGAAAATAPRPLQLGTVDVPLLLLPFAAALSRTSARPLVLLWGDARCVLRDGRLVEVNLGTGGGLTAETVNMEFGSAVADEATAPDPDDRRLPAAAQAAALAALTEHAARTYVPDSSTSRLRGAGAGLRDDD